MRRSAAKAVICAGIEDVWSAVTNNGDYSWRSDLSRIEILDDARFVEYTKSGRQTLFTITKKEPFSKYEFDMENKFFHGHWIGTFDRINDRETKIIFTEELNIKNPVIEILSYLFLNLKKIQRTYVSDLRRKLEKL